MGTMECRAGPEASHDVFMGQRGSMGRSRCPRETGKAGGGINSIVAFMSVKDTCKQNSHASYRNRSDARGQRDKYTIQERSHVQTRDNQLLRAEE